MGKSKQKKCIYVSKSRTVCKNKEVINGISFCNKHLNKLYNLKIKKSGIKGAGYGLFAGTHGFKKGEIISEYSRYDIKSNKDPCDNTREKMHICSEYLFCEKNTCWDARYNPDIVARYANDARSSRKNNAYFDILGGRVFIMADRKIKPGAEIFVDYGEDYDWSFLD